MSLGHSRILLGKGVSKEPPAAWRVLATRRPRRPGRLVGDGALAATGATVAGDAACDTTGTATSAVLTGVVRRPLRQWVLKITAYAERLLKDLELVNWPESIKEQQRNWIGRSEGAEVDFKTEDGDVLRIFTTREELPR